MSPAGNRRIPAWRERVRIAPEWQGVTGVAALLRSPPDSAELLSQSARSRVWKLVLAGHALVMKEYRSPSPLRRLARGLRRSKAERCWRAAGRLAQLGIPAMRRVAVRESRFGPLVWEAGFVGTWLPGPDLRDALLGGEVSASLRRERAWQAVNLVGRIHSAGLVHGDLKAANLRFTPQGPAVVDLDDVHAPLAGPRRAYMMRRDWRILLHNWRRDPDIHALFAELIRDYLGPAAFSRVRARPFRR